MIYLSLMLPNNGILVKFAYKFMNDGMETKLQNRHFFISFIIDLKTNI